MKHNISKMGFSTRQIHAGKLSVPGIEPLVTPIFQSSTFVFENAAQGAARFACNEDGYIYTRPANPNSDQIGAKVASLENAEDGLAFGSGMGAITTLFWTVLRSGDHVLADETLYGCTFAFLQHGVSKYGVDVTFTDFSDPSNIARNMRDNTKVVYFETPANPNMKIIDIKAVSAAVHEINSSCKVIVDNTFCTPYIQRPLDLGADVVVHSGTKYLNGHGDVVAGFIIGKSDFIKECRFVGMKELTGAILSPFDSFLIARGLKTLSIRMERHCNNASTIAKYLDKHPKVKKVYYPGLETSTGFEIAKKQMSLPGGIMSFELVCDKAKSEKFINSLQLCTLAVSLGDAETLIQHPASMTHSTYSPAQLESAGIPESMIRLSVGLEDVEDIIADLEQGLEKI